MQLRRLIPLLSLSAFALAAALPAQSRMPERRFGAVEAYDSPGAAAQAGVGWERAIYFWPDIQPNGPQEFRASKLSDGRLASELRAGREVVGLIIGVPAWARDTRGVPHGVTLGYNDPQNTWATFVGRLVGRYKDRIRIWIIWNEPDVTDPAAPSYTWPGTIEEYAALHKSAYLAAKAANPRAYILLAPMQHWYTHNAGQAPYLGRLLDVIKSDPQAEANNFYFDALSLNFYTMPWPNYDLILQYRGMMNGRGMDKPMWLVETNAAPTNDPAWPVANPAFPVTLNQQANYIPQMMSLALAAGVSRIQIYKMVDTATDRAANPEPFGLVRRNGSRRPAFQGFATANRYLAGFRSAVLKEREGWARVLVDQPTAYTHVLWTLGPQAVTAMVPAQTTTAALVDQNGRSRPIQPVNGVYQVELAGSECLEGSCFIGGPVMYLVESIPH